MSEYDTLIDTPEGRELLGWKPLPAAPVAPAFETAWLPRTLREMVEAVAENIGVPIDLPALIGLGVASACACGRVKIQVDVDRYEPIQLYILCAMGSGQGKTPAYNRMTSLLFERQLEENKAWKNNRKAVISVMNGLSGESGFADARQLEEAFEISCRLLDGSDLDYEMLDAYITYRNSRGSAAANALMLATDNEDYKAYRENTTKMFLSLLGSDASLSSLDDIRDKFMQACAVTCINENDDVSKVIEKLKKYNGIFRLDFGAKSDFSTVPELDVAMSFVGDRSFSSPEEITAEFNRRVGELKSKGSSGSGSGGGSVGSGSGSSGNKGGFTPSGTNDYSRIDDILNRDYPFYDVARDSWAREYIKFVYDNNIMTGDGDGNFRPNDCISREEIVKTLFAAFAIKTDEAVSEFKDVDPDSWSYPYISKAYEMTVVNGISDDLFAPKEKITRQDAAALIYRLTKMTRSGYEFTSADITFTDKDDIAEYAQEAMKTLISMGVIGGYDDGSFRPCQTITRAETAKIIMTLLNAVG